MELICNAVGGEPEFKTKVTKTELQQLYQMAADISSVCSQLDLPIWMDGGTLLGAVRHKGFIPWDDDVDFAIFYSDSERFVNHVQPLLLTMGYAFCPRFYGGYRIFRDPKLFPDVTVIEEDSGCGFPFADVFFVDLHEDNPEVLSYGTREARLLWSSGLTLKDLHPITQYPFGPLHLPGPSNPSPHLNVCYGTDWAECVYMTKNHKTDVVPKNIIKTPVQWGTMQYVYYV